MLTILAVIGGCTLAAALVLGVGMIVHDIGEVRDNSLKKWVLLNVGYFNDDPAMVRAIVGLVGRHDLHELQKEWKKAREGNPAKPATGA